MSIITSLDKQTEDEISSDKYQQGKEMLDIFSHTQYFKNAVTEV